MDGTGLFRMGLIFKKFGEGLTLNKNLGNIFAECMELSQGMNIFLPDSFWLSLGSTLGLFYKIFLISCQQWILVDQAARSIWVSLVV